MIVQTDCPNHAFTPSARKPPDRSGYNQDMETTRLTRLCRACGEDLRDAIPVRGGVVSCGLCGVVAGLADPREALERLLSRSPRWLPAEEDR